MRVLAVLLLLCSAAAADMWGKWQPKRVADPFGRYYVVLRYQGEPWTTRYAFARIGEDSPPVEAEELEAYENWHTWTNGGGLREGDRVLARGRLPDPPFDVIVSATGMGFVGVEVWWSFGHEDSVTIVPADGGPHRTVRLTDLFTPREIEAYPRSVTAIWWLRGAWLDDEARKVVVVARDGKLRTVGWDDGVVAEGADADIVRALSLPYPKARELALDLAAERHIAAAKEPCAAILADLTEPLLVRLRAAVALALLGDLSGKELVVSHAVAERSLEEDPAAEYAIAHLPDVLREEAIPLLTECMRKGTAEAKWGFFRLGHRAVPALAELVREGNAEAIDAIEWLGARSAVPALLEAISAEDAWTAEQAARLAMEFSGDEIAPQLVAALRRGTQVPHVLAGFFQKVKCPEVVPLLVVALEHPPEGVYDWELERIGEALTFQTGEDFGIDAAAWRRWLDGRK